MTDYIYLTTFKSNVIMKLSKDGTSIIKQHSVKAAGHTYVAIVGEEVMACERDNKGTIMVYDRKTELCEEDSWYRHGRTSCSRCRFHWKHICHRLEQIACSCISVIKVTT